jgi:hypothetical protein
MRQFQSDIQANAKKKKERETNIIKYFTGEENKKEEVSSYWIT